MSVAGLMTLSARDVLRRFADRRLTPTDYLAVCLERISKVNPKINALTAIDTERAIFEAAQASSRWSAGTPKGPLDGLPIGVKDIQDTEGLLTSHGSPRMRSYVPKSDFPMVARLRNAGAIILAKTNVPECGAGGNSRNPVWGATANPFDANLIAGGSSGGSAAALAANLLPVCTGSDTGGSLRLPAALCGIVGFRPSVDVIAHPTRPLGWSGISVLGPMTRTVDDLTLILSISHGYHPDDPLSAQSAQTRFTTLPDVDLSALRVGYSEDFGGAPVDLAIRETFRDRIEKIAPHVQDCCPVDLNLGNMDRCFDILRAESFLAAFGEVTKTEPTAFGLDIQTNVELGQSMSLADRAWAHAEQTRILRRFNALMQDFDVILLPTAPVSPFPWTQGHAAEIEGQSMDIYYRWLALTYRGSLAGGPSITLPCGRDPQGMPFGLQVLGAVRSDEALLATAKSLETLFAGNPDMARPCPDMTSLTPSGIDLRSIVTHPPVMDRDVQSKTAPLGTAV
ncbi:amidase [Pseudorhodobacter sp. W20_MBD10_FR17]|uniref:amidase n=1 Tax=Pseudorhodobacter sp. W20_MBD10_FR17 TaxID=3240266 RepID=UPI003F9B97E4